MKLKVLILILVYISTISGSSSARCKCIPFKDCHYFVNKMIKPTINDLLTFKSAICGFQKNNYQVCCPKATLPTKCGQTLYSGNQRIVGGTIVPIGRYPWMAILKYKKRNDKFEFLCGASLINKNYLLSAAHCFQDAYGVAHPQKIHSVHLGEWDLYDDRDCQERNNGKLCAPSHYEILIDPEDVILHPQYNKRFMHSDDIALIRMKTPIDFKESFPFVQPICIPPQGLQLERIRKEVRNITVVAGWGRTRNETTSRYLREVDVEIKDNSFCKDIFKEFGNTQICAGGAKDEDSCSGDSGGPLFIEGPKGAPFLQLGIVSYGHAQCGVKGIPAVYTSVSHYRRWIDDNIFE